MTAHAYESFISQPFTYILKCYYSYFILSYLFSFILYLNNCYSDSPWLHPSSFGAKSKMSHGFAKLENALKRANGESCVTNCNRISSVLLTFLSFFQSWRQLGTRRRLSDYCMRFYSCAGSPRGAQFRRSVNPSCASIWSFVYSFRTTGMQKYIYLTYELDHDQDSCTSRLICDSKSVFICSICFFWGAATSLLLRTGTRRMGFNRIRTWVSRRIITQCL